MRRDLPESVSDSIETAVLFDIKELTSSNEAMLGDAFAAYDLLTADLFRDGQFSQADQLKAAHRVMTRSQQIDGALKGSFRYTAASVYGRLMPPPAMLRDLVTGTLATADNRSPYETASLLTKIHPCSVGNGLLSRLVYIALSEKQAEDIKVLEEEDIAKALDEQIQWLASYPVGRGKSLDQYDQHHKYKNTYENTIWGRLLRQEIDG